MKKSLITLAVAGFVAITTAFTPADTKLVSKKGHISFFSHTAVEDITANNYQVVSTLNTTSGEVVFSVPMQSFEFEKAKMQQHYNSPKFLDTKEFPKAKFKGNISNLEAIDFTKDGTYNADVSGELTLHGITKPISEKGTVTVKGDKVVVDTKMEITLAEYEIAFESGKPSTNIAKTIEITVKAEFDPEN
jgi:polyisoprenoid-binding protein YceI